MAKKYVSHVTLRDDRTGKLLVDQRFDLDTWDVLPLTVAAGATVTQELHPHALDGSDHFIFFAFSTVRGVTVKVATSVDNISTHDLNPWSGFSVCTLAGHASAASATLINGTDRDAHVVLGYGIHAV